MSEENQGSVLYAVVHYPHLACPGLNEFRRRYDPFAELIAEHLTVVFPVPVDRDTIWAHVQSVAGKIPPFDIRISGLERTWDHWMYLAVEEGSDEIIALHDQLYSGPLQEHLRTDLPFEPHVGLGFFGKGPYDPLDPEPIDLDSEAYTHALREAAQFGIDAKRRVESLNHVRLDMQRGNLEDVATVRLGS